MTNTTVRRWRIYIAAPIRQGDTLLNIHNAMNMWFRLRKVGYSPFLPHLNIFLELQEPNDAEFWLAYDLEWLEVCHAILRLEGKSNGADREINAMTTWGRPCYYSVKDLVQHLPPKPGPTHGPFTTKPAPPVVQRARELRTEGFRRTPAV